MFNSTMILSYDERKSLKIRIAILENMLLLSQIPNDSQRSGIEGFLVQSSREEDVEQILCALDESRSTLSQDALKRIEIQQRIDQLDPSDRIAVSLTALLEM